MPSMRFENTGEARVRRARSTGLLIILLLMSFTAFGQNSQLVERRAAAERAYDQALAELTSGRGSAEAVYTWSARWLTAHREAAPNQATMAAQAHLQRMLNLQRTVQRHVAGGTYSPSSSAACEYYVAEARIWLRQASP